jgi:hypothetical protein
MAFSESRQANTQAFRVSERLGEQENCSRPTCRGKTSAGHQSFEEIDQSRDVPLTDANDGET